MSESEVSSTTIAGLGFRKIGERRDGLGYFCSYELRGVEVQVLVDRGVTQILWKPSSGGDWEYLGVVLEYVSPSLSGLQHLDAAPADQLQTMSENLEKMVKLASSELAIEELHRFASALAERAASRY